MIKIKAMRYTYIDSHKAITQAEKDRFDHIKETLEAVDSHMTLIHTLLEEIGYRPFGRLNLTIPGQVDDITFEWSK